MKTFFIKLHRILGSILSLVFVIWFVSGFVMIYSGFPHASKKKSFERQETLGKYKHLIQDYKEDTIAPQYLKLEIHHGKPYYSYKKQWIDATTLSTVASFSTSAIDSLILTDYGASITSKEILTDFDSWIPWEHFQDYFPIHKYYLNDDKKTEVYLSQKTGKVVQETTARKRWFARFGAIPHWFYYKSLRLKQDLWATVVIWLSAIGCIMCLSGLIVGIYRSRKWRKAKKRGLFGFSPYKKKWYKWHHIVGLTFGFFVFTFVFSGMLSMMSIPNWLLPIDKTINYSKIWREEACDFSKHQLSVQELLANKKLADAKTIEWRQIDSIPYYLVYKEYQKPLLIDARVPRKELEQKIFSINEIKQIAARKFQDHQYSLEKLTTSDGYYTQLKNPLAKLRFQDANKSWLYIDLHNPDFTPSLNKSRRLRRWLYRGLHTFNFPIFEKMDWMRKTLLILVSILGTFLSISGLVLSYKYIRRKNKKWRKKQ